jgi:phage-related protein
MSRDLSALFAEEATKTEQSRILHLITVELYDAITTGITSTLNPSVLTVANAAEFRVGNEVKVKRDYEYPVKRTIVAISGNVVTLNAPLDTLNKTYTISTTVFINIVDSNYDVDYGGVTYLRFPVKFGEMSVSSDGSIDKASIAVANVSREITYYVEKYDGLRNRQIKVKTVFERFLDKKYFLKRERGVFSDDVAYIVGDTVEYDGNKYTAIKESVGEFSLSNFTLTADNEQFASMVNPEADASAHIEDSFIIDNYSYDENVCTFQLDPAIDLSVKLPRRKYTNDSCPWKYRDPTTCGYTGPGVTGETGCPKTLYACKARNNQARFGGFPGITGNRRVYF